MAKPAKVPEWDSGQVNTLEPTVTHKAEGWLIPGGVPEKPTLQEYNYWMNNVFNWINEINQVGILSWDAVTTYAIGAYVIGSDFRIYKALTAANQNNDPVGDPVNWLDVIAAATIDGSITMAKLSSSATEADNVDRRVAKAWVNFNGQGVVAIRDDFNVSSITDVGPGIYTINFTANMADANYCPVLGCAFTDSGVNNLSANVVDPLAMTVAALPIIVQTSGGTNFDSELVTCTVFGEQ